MRVDKQTLPIYISIALSLITFLTIWGLGGIGLLIIQKFLPVLFGVWILTFLLVLSVPKLKEIVSLSATTSAFIIYLGVLFISLARFKEEIAKGNIDINVLGVGLALIAIALVLTTQHKEKQINDKDNNRSAENSIIKASDETEETLTKQEPPSIDIVLDEVRRKLDFQFEQLDGYSTKSGIVLGVAGVIFTLLVTNLLGQSDKVTNLILAKVALIPIFISIVLSFVPIYIRKLERPPNLERLRFHYIVKDTKETKLKIIDISREAVKDNDKLLKRIVRFIKCSYFFLLIGLVLLAVWIVMIIW